MIVTESIIYTIFLLLSRFCFLKTDFFQVATNICVQNGLGTEMNDNKNNKKVQARQYAPKLSIYCFLRRLFASLCIIIKAKAHTQKTEKKSYKGNAKLIKITAFKCMIITVVKYFFFSFIHFISFSIYCLRNRVSEKRDGTRSTELTKTCSNKNQIKICVLQQQQQQESWWYTTLKSKPQKNSTRKEKKHLKRC